MVNILFKRRSFIIKWQVGAKCECQSAQQGELLCRWGSCQGKISRIGWAKRRQTHWRQQREIPVQKLRGRSGPRAEMRLNRYGGKSWGSWAVGRSHKNVKSTHIVGPDPQQRKQERQEVWASWALGQDKCDVYVRTADLGMSRNLGSYTLPPPGQATSVMVIMLGISCSSCIVSNLAVNDAVDIFHQVLFWNQKNDYYTTSWFAFGEERRLSWEVGWPQRASYLRGQLKFGIKIHDCPPSQVGERAYLKSTL